MNGKHKEYEPIDITRQSKHKINNFKANIETESCHLKQKKKNDLGTKESPRTIGGEEEKGKRERNSYLEI